MRRNALYSDNMEYEVSILGSPKIRVATLSSLFSPRGLDSGTAFLLETVKPFLKPDQQVLDLGCGSGVVSLWLLQNGYRVQATDCDPLAVQQTVYNLSENHLPTIPVYLGSALEALPGFPKFEEPEFDWILSNPPYHTDYAVAKSFIEQGFRALRQGGKLALVVKRSLWYERKLRTTFGGCQIYTRTGYTVLVAEKRREISGQVLRKRAKDAARRERNPSTRTHKGKRRSHR